MEGAGTVKYPVRITRGLHGIRGVEAGALITQEHDSATLDKLVEWRKVNQPKA